MKTVSLDLAKQLKEAGYPQNTYFGWHLQKGTYLLEPTNDCDYQGNVGVDCYSAPTAEEILEKLPYLLKNSSTLKIMKDDKNRYAILYTIFTETYHGFYWYKSLAEAAAKMYLYLKKQNLI